MGGEVTLVESGDRKMAKERKPYVKPTVTQLTAEQVKEKHLRLVRKGDPKAKELLEKMLPEDPRTNPKRGKKSA